jgi:hypothetical protein
MQKIIDYLNGKKTVISAIATAIWGALYSQHVINDQTFQAGAVVECQPGITVLHPADVKPTVDVLIQPANSITSAEAK